MIYFTKHAEEKFVILKRHKFSVLKNQVLETVNDPDHVDTSRLPLLIAQRTFDKTHLLRVVYKVEFGTKIIITFYPGRKTQYAQKI